MDRNAATTRVLVCFHSVALKDCPGLLPRLEVAPHISRESQTVHFQRFDSASSLTVAEAHPYHGEVPPMPA
jgi:hypothetical protein